MKILSPARRKTIIIESSNRGDTHKKRWVSLSLYPPYDSDLPAGRKIGILQSESKQNLYHTLGISASAMNILEAIESEQLVLVEGRSDRVYIEALQAKRRNLFPVPQERKVAFGRLTEFLIYQTNCRTGKTF